MTIKDDDTTIIQVEADSGTFVAHNTSPQILMRCNVLENNNRAINGIIEQFMVILF